MNFQFFLNYGKKFDLRFKKLNENSKKDFVWAELKDFFKLRFVLYKPTQGETLIEIHFRKSIFLDKKINRKTIILFRSSRLCIKIRNVQPRYLCKPY